MLAPRELKVLNPPARIGVVGGGQLGRMLAMVAKRMGYEIWILDPAPNSPAGQVSDHQIVAQFSDAAAVRELAANTDILTYEFEQIDADILCELEEEGLVVCPSGRTLQKIKDKFIQKTLLKEAGLPVPDFWPVNSKEDVLNLLKNKGRLVLKTCSGGYDGKGYWFLKDQADVEEAFQAFKGLHLMAEAHIDFKMEISILAARGKNGVTRFYPVAENQHQDGILYLTRVPARISETVAMKAKEVAQGVLETLNDYGLYCIEMFLTQDDQIYINEIAPRPHNSGHYTIEACKTSQYEQLIRVLAGLPLGSTELITPCAMVNILGDGKVQGTYEVAGLEEAMLEEDVFVHLYNKKNTDKRKKLGHITVLAEDTDLAEAKALRAIRKIKIKAK